MYVLTVVWSIRLFMRLWKSGFSFGNCTFAVKERERAAVIYSVRLNNKD